MRQCVKTSEAASKYPYHTALHAYIAGSAREPDVWTTLEFMPTQLEKGKTYRVVYKIAANDNDFPILKACNACAWLRNLRNRE